MTYWRRGRWAERTVWLALLLIPLAVGYKDGLQAMMAVLSVNTLVALFIVHEELRARIERLRREMRSLRQ
jgi:hypothetical protein